MTAPVGTAPRLGIVTNDFLPRPGGIQQYLAGLVAAYPGEVVVLAPADGPADTPATVIRHRRRFMWPTPGTSDWVTAELRNASVELVLFGAPWPLPAMTERSVPASTSRWRWSAMAPRSPSRRRSRGSRRGCAGCWRPPTCASRSAGSRRRRMERLTGLPVHYLGAGVDLDRFAPGPRPAQPATVVGCVSRFVPRKGQHILLDAVAELIAEGIDLEVVLAGRGRRERSLRSRARRLGVPVRFVVDAPWDDLPAIYRSLDLFAMPCMSRWFGLEVEGLGLVFLEAAASGLAVVAGDSGGSPETVADGVTGLVVRDHRTLVEALRRLVTAPDLRARMGIVGRARVEAEFTWEAVVDRLRAGFAGAQG